MLIKPTVWFMVLLTTSFGAGAQAPAPFNGLTEAGLPISIFLDELTGIERWDISLTCDTIQQSSSITLTPPCELETNGDFTCGVIEDCFFGTTYSLQGNRLGDTITGSVTARLAIFGTFECCDVTVEYSAIQTDEDLIFSDSFES